MDFPVDFAWSAAVLTVQIGLDLFGYIFIPLARKHVCRCLHAYHLAHRRDQRRVAEIFTHARHFREHFIKLIK